MQVNTGNGVSVQSQSQSQVQVGGSSGVQSQSQGQSQKGGSGGQSQSQSQTQVSAGGSKPVESCTDSLKFDLMFVNDESGSIGADNYQKSLNFMVDVLKGYKDQIDAGDVRVGVITYSDYVDLQISLAKHTFKYLKNTIQGLKYKGGTTQTGAAIKKGNKNLDNNGRSSVEQILMVITDGKSNDNVKTPSDNARKDGITCMAVGVGNYKESELMDIAGQDSSLVFEVTDYDALSGFTKQITETISSIGSGGHGGASIQGQSQSQGQWGKRGFQSQSQSQTQVSGGNGGSIQHQSQSQVQVGGGSQHQSQSQSQSQGNGGQAQHQSQSQSQGQGNGGQGQHQSQGQSQGQGNGGQGQHQSQGQGQGGNGGSSAPAPAPPAPQKPDNNFIACEHQGTKTLSCPSGSVLHINSAYYGRQSTKECPGAGDHVTGCVASGSEDKIEDLCEGKQSCVINPDNSVFGDPCGGTVKYVEVDYDCVAAAPQKPAEPTCKDSNGAPLSTGPFEKPGSCTQFYQCGAGILYTKNCGPGTAFNPSISVCDWPYNVPGCGESEEEESTANNPLKKVFKRGFQKQIQSQVQITGPNGGSIQMQSQSQSQASRAKRGFQA